MFNTDSPQIYGQRKGGINYEKESMGFFEAEKAYYDMDTLWYCRGYNVSLHSNRNIYTIGIRYDNSIYSLDVCGISILVEWSAVV